MTEIAARGHPHPTLRPAGARRACHAPTPLEWRESAAGRSVALVGTYPPTHCGLATFTANLRTAVAASDSGWTASVVQVVADEAPAEAPEVVAHWNAGDRRSLQRVLDTLVSFDVVLLQHEFGLFAGADGDEVLDLVAGLVAPLVAVLHTVQKAPSAHQRHVLEQILDAADMAVVQSEAARQRIVEVHGADPDRVVVIPHGAAANFDGPTLSSVPHPAVLTWGLLGPGKGIEHGIDAVARLARHHPAPSYVVAGQTHPKVRASSGERYRETLKARAVELGVAQQVRFDDGYRDWDALRALVRSADVVLLPYESREQVSSGVLVEAVASGRPVVATRFPHAEELLGDGAGLLVDHGDVEAMAVALHRVLYEPGLADRMSAVARRAAEPLMWPSVGIAYRALIEQVIGAAAVA